MRVKIKKVLQNVEINSIVVSVIVTTDKCHGTHKDECRWLKCCSVDGTRGENVINFDKNFEDWSTLNGRGGGENHTRSLFHKIFLRS